MARIGGRSLWLAIPVGMLCVGIVGALVWLAVPMVPVTVAWVGDSLRASTEASAASDEAQHPAQLLADGEAIDCRDVYPDTLWAELIWHGDVLLSQNAQPAPVSTPELIDALAPSVQLTCAWRLGGGGSIVSSIATVAPEAASIAEATLAPQGFSCTTSGSTLTCVRGGEHHVVRDGLWIASVVSAWAPDDYATRLAQYVWE